MKKAVLKLGSNMNVPVVDAYLAMEGNTNGRAIYLHDGLHLSKEGNMMLCETFKKVYHSYFEFIFFFMIFINVIHYHYISDTK